MQHSSQLDLLLMAREDGKVCGQDVATGKQKVIGCLCVGVGVGVRSGTPESRFISTSLLLVPYTSVIRNVWKDQYTRPD